MSEQHSTLPWRVVPLRTHCAVWTMEHRRIARLYRGAVNPSHAADAEFIVRAVNNHDSLVAALKDVTDHLARVMAGPMIAGHGIEFINGVDGIPTIKAAREAIAKAEGRE